MIRAEEVRKKLEAAGVAPGPAARLGVYGELLGRWSRIHNLVRFRDVDELVQRHLLDALAGAPALPEPHGLLLDAGSGAGLPGLPLLLARPGWRGLLVEPRRKRWAFLRTAVRELGVDAEVLRARYQEITPPAPLTVVTARALGGYDELLAWARPYVAPSGRVLLWLGAEEARRLGRLPAWRMVSSPLPTLDQGFLAELRPCFT